jgi:tRNA/rRNA methyltransferase
MTHSLSIILTRPQMGENIGAAARAMANFGLRDLRLVAPRDGWPNPKASDMAGRALDIVDDAKLFATAPEAVADCQFVLATTARERAMNLPVLDVREAAAELEARAARGERCAVLFGPERTGLENEEVTLANAVVTIPVAPEYPSLNLAQAVVVVAYEWMMAQAELSRAIPQQEEAPATREQLNGLFGHLETALDTVNFWRIPAKKEIMWRNIRAGLTRAGLTAQEVATWRGIVKALSEK